MIRIRVPFGYPTGPDDPDLEVILPNPTLGDSVSQSLKTKFGFSMSGRIVTTVSPQPEKKLQYNFDKLKRSDVDALLALIDAWGSDFWEIRDWNLDIWKVKCLSNPIEFTENVHFYSCQLEFQGIIV